MQMRALTLRALAHRALGKPESAIADCLRAVDLIPMKPIGKMVDTPTLRRLSRESWAMTQQVAVLGHELATQSGKTREAELFWKRIETSRELLAKFGI